MSQITPEEFDVIEQDRAERFAKIVERVDEEIEDPEIQTSVKERWEKILKRETYRKLDNTTAIVTGKCVHQPYVDEVLDNGVNHLVCLNCGYGKYTPLDHF